MLAIDAAGSALPIYMSNSSTRSVQAEIRLRQFHNGLFATLPHAFHPVRPGQAIFSQLPPIFPRQYSPLFHSLNRFQNTLIYYQGPEAASGRESSQSSQVKSSQVEWSEAPSQSHRQPVIIDFHSSGNHRLIIIPESQHIFATDWPNFTKIRKFQKFSKKSRKT